MKINKVKTDTGSLNDILQDGSMMIEESDGGRILFLNSNGNLEWEFVNKDDNDNIYLINWSRLIQNKPLIKSIKQKIQNTKCTNK